MTCSAVQELLDGVRGLDKINITASGEAQQQVELLLVQHAVLTISPGTGCLLLGGCWLLPGKGDDLQCHLSVIAGMREA